jgi:hypothetical protein
MTPFQVLGCLIGFVLKNFMVTVGIIGAGTLIAILVRNPPFTTELCL